MKRLWQLCAMALAFVWSFGCSTTEFTSTWKDPSAQATEFRGKRVAAFVLTKDEARRRAAEDALAMELAKRGVQAIPGYKIVPSDQVADKEAVRAKLREQNVAGAVVMRVVDRRQEVELRAGLRPRRTGLRVVLRVLGLRVVLGRLRRHEHHRVGGDPRLLRAGREAPLGRGQRDVRPDRLDKTIKEIVDEAAKEMKKAGLDRPR